MLAIKRNIFRSYNPVMLNNNHINYSFILLLK